MNSIVKVNTSVHFVRKTNDQQDEKQKLENTIENLNNNIISRKIMPKTQNVHFEPDFNNCKFIKEVKYISPKSNNTLICNNKISTLKNYNKNNSKKLIFVNKNKMKIIP